MHSSLERSFHRGLTKLITTPRTSKLAKQNMRKIPFVSCQVAPFSDRHVAITNTADDRCAMHEKTPDVRGGSEIKRPFLQHLRNIFRVVRNPNPGVRRNNARLPDLSIPWV